MNKTLSQIVFIFCCAIVFASCKKEPATPKPMGHERIDIPQHSYVASEFENFSFDRSDLSTVEKAGNDRIDWFNLNYPAFSAKIYFTYLSITPQKLGEMAAESHKLAYSHAVKADNITQNLYSDSENKVYGIVYTLEGDVATPCQFFLTDSTSNFIRGSFYYNSYVKSDSVGDITKMIREDVKTIVSSLRWKKN